VTVGPRAGAGRSAPWAGRPLRQDPPQGSRPGV